MTANDQELLGQFAREQSQDAFTALVNRHLNLVYSAALRQVRSPQLAQEVSQAVFTQLAHHAAKLRPDTVLTAWLYQVTRHAAIDVVRQEARRQAREQIAFQMSDLNEPAADWPRIEPLLDEAMQSLDDTDRTAVLLRFFENKSLREVGEALGASEDAAQKRISRALDRLRVYFAKRKVAVTTSGLAALVSAHAIQAAPAGLAVSVAAGAVVASSAISTSTAITLAKTIAMTTAQKIVVTVLVTGAVAAALYQTHQVGALRSQVQSFEQQQAQQHPLLTALSNQVQELGRERDRATNALAAITTENANLKKHPTEVLKLRGEVGRLRQENAEFGSSSALSKVTANPEARKMLRDQQKLGMGVIYKGFAQRVKLTDEQADKFNDLLADHIMDDVEHVTVALRDKMNSEQVNALFTAQEQAIQAKVQEMLGQDGLTQYQEYSKNILSTLSTDQFKGNLTGTDEVKANKAKQLQQIMQEEVQAIIAANGLPADYQAVPILNFRNIASEQEAERNLKYLEDIYQRTAARSAGLLDADELKKFDDFKNTAVKSSRMALTMNRTMMAPLASDAPKR